MKQQFIRDQTVMVSVIEEISKEITKLEERKVSPDFIEQKRTQLDKIINFYDQVEKYINSYDYSLKIVRATNSYLEQYFIETANLDNMKLIDNIVNSYTDHANRPQQIKPEK